MGLDAKHPSYTTYHDIWVKNRDVYKGSEAIKEKGITYLPATSGMHLDGMAEGESGKRDYDAYKLRAEFPEVYREGVDMLVGMMHRKPADIKLPSALEFMREKATITGEGLSLLLRRINAEQLCPGRLGLLLDFNVVNNIPVPYISLYYAEAIVNWDESNDYISQNRLQFVQLNESGYYREQFEWKARTQYRVLQLGEQLAEETANKQSVYFGTFTVEGTGTPIYAESDMKELLVRGQPLTDIPFVFVNSRDLLAEPDMPPLNGLANLSLCIYRGEADYRQTLYQQSQETLVVIGSVRNPDGVEGEDDAIRIGTGSRIDIDVGGDAKFIGVSGAGLSEQRTAIENDYARAEKMSGQLTDEGGNKESGEALKVRVSAQTANLVQIALTGAKALETILKMCAVAMGANPEEVEIGANLEFSNAPFNAQDLTQYMAARNMGVPLSLESIHALLVDKGITKLDFRTEKKLFDKERETEMESLTGTGTDLDDHNHNDDGDDENDTKKKKVDNNE